MWLWFRIWTKILADRQTWRKKGTDRRICIPLFTPLLVPGARFLEFAKAPLAFRARTAIFSSSLCKQGELCKPETFCMKGTSVLRLCGWNSSVILCNHNWSKRAGNEWEIPRKAGSSSDLWRSNLIQNGEDVGWIRTIFYDCKQTTSGRNTVSAHSYGQNESPGRKNWASPKYTYHDLRMTKLWVLWASRIWSRSHQQCF